MKKPGPKFIRVLRKNPRKKTLGTTCLKRIVII